MNCQQKSGVFLNIECQRIKEDSCSVCNKNVCKTHLHILANTYYCEDCYWEHYLLTDDIRPSTQRLDTTSGGFVYSSNTSSGSNTEGFAGGFGGGEFGGGGAAGEWTEGDMHSLHVTTDQQDTTAPLGLAGDDTFYYS